MGILQRSASIRTEQTETQDSGYTLIELLVVVGIIAVLSTMLVGFSRKNNQQLILVSTEAKVLSLISRAKFLAIETFFEDLGGSPAVKICGYGVHVDRAAGEIFIFQDIQTGMASCPANNIYGGRDNKLSGGLDVVKLDSSVVSIKNNTNLKNINFIPPDPDIKINGGADTSAFIDIGLVDGDGSFKIVVTDAGQVRAE